MNDQIEQWRVQAYASNVLHLSQQKGSRLASSVRKEMFKGKTEYFDRLASTVALDKTSRNSDTPNEDITHSRRAVTTVTRHWGTLVDKKDKLQNIHSPESEYAQAASNALGRKMDDVIIAAVHGTAVTGETGSGSQSLGNAQKIAAVSGGAISKLNVLALRTAKQVLDAAEAEGMRYFVLNASSLNALLGQTEVTSSDYNSVKALVQGELDTFLGFKFIRSERIPLFTTYDVDNFIFNTSTGVYDAAGTDISGLGTAATHVSNFAYVGDGCILGMNDGAFSKIEPRSDKSYSMQVYASMDFGSVRMEEAKVVSVACLA